MCPSKASTSWISRGHALLAGVGFKLADIPAAGLLAFVVLLLSIMQIGAAVVMLPVIVWIWIDKDVVTSVLLTLFLGIVSILDNIMNPLLLGRGLTPMLMILIGVIGGTLAHGIVGLFIGPIILSMARNWPWPGSASAVPRR